MDKHKIIEELLGGDLHSVLPEVIKVGHVIDSARVKAGSNTSTVTLRVVGGNEKGNLKFETVIYGLGPEKDCTGKDQQHIQKTGSSSRQRGHPQKTRP
jgi:hypothetical protein